ncbi:hypothetical protein UFOVP415_47 [uncultured Caudovirales phage]|uniref:Uncharacterized protein n=1 Tax=uncultured Caudovirales phage TaxID=2100421 RepID=A0A6J5MCU7_9CAUD|nr:hypothetical protein UFOVP415_47 [uncultured Caudovirales phage]
MATTKLTFGEWMPDQPGISGALTDAKNVVSQAIGYGPLPTAAIFSAAASENLTTLVAGKTPANATKLFAAGSTKIFDVSGVGVLTNVSKTGGYTPNANADRFRFTQFGNVIIGTNFSNPMQAYTLGTSTAFADLAAGAPICKFLTVVRDFVVTAFTDESSTTYPSRVRWSGINDETTWGSSQVTQADFQDIPDGGQIVGIRGGEFGLVFLEKGISRMTYIGTPFVFQFDNISRGKGCIAAGSIAQTQGMSFFLSDDGFYMCDGQTIQGIGSEKVDRWFFENADESAFETMSASIDPVRKLVIWNFKTLFAQRQLIIYNFKTQKWTYGDAGTDYVSDASTAATTLEGLDSISTSIDALTVSLDSILYMGGKYFLGGTLGPNVVTYNGAPAVGQIVTGDIAPGGRSIVTLARPQIDNGSATVAVASRVMLNQDVTFGSAVAADSENRVSLRSNGNYHRFRVVPTGANWKTAVGMDIDLAGQGAR